MSSSTLTLYVGNGCKFCDRVLDYLKQHPMKVDIKEVWDNEANFEELKALTGGQTQVPCLKFDDTFMHESLDIIEKLKTF
jgi:glutaredoxin 3